MQMWNPLRRGGVSEREMKMWGKPDRYSIRLWRATAQRKPGTSFWNFACTTAKPDPCWHTWWHHIYNNQGAHHLWSHAGETAFIKGLITSQTLFQTISSTRSKCWRSLPSISDDQNNFFHSELRLCSFVARQEEPVWELIVRPHKAAFWTMMIQETVMLAGELRTISALGHTQEVFCWARFLFCVASLCRHERDHR